ncbi:MAG: alpha/beta hydrolase [Bacteroidetes bacterium]|nr:alpha/beta hydrolase [Bacteroidota bacterium]
MKSPIKFLSIALAGALLSLSAASQKPPTPQKQTTQQPPQKLSPGEHYAQLPNLKLHYYIAGKGPVLLFPSPGWGISVDYARHMKSLEKHFTVVYYDTRLSGKSTGPEDSTQYTGADFTADMDNLRIYLNQEKIWIAGHSGGGFQVLRYGIHHSDHLHGIIEIDALACADSAYVAEITRLTHKRSNQPYYTPERAALFMGFEPNPPGLAYELSQTMEFYFHDTTKIKKLPNDFLLSDKVRHYTTHLFDENLLPDLHKITVPVLVIVGDDDIVCDLKTQALRIFENLKFGSFSIINNCGHIPWVEQPAIFEAVCDTWLKEVNSKK